MVLVRSFGDKVVHMLPPTICIIKARCRLVRAMAIQDGKNRPHLQLDVIQSCRITMMVLHCGALHHSRNEWEVCANVSISIMFYCSIISPIELVIWIRKFLVSVRSEGVYIAWLKKIINAILLSFEVINNFFKNASKANNKFFGKIKNNGTSKRCKGWSNLELKLQLSSDFVFACTYIVHILLILILANHTTNFFCIFNIM